MKKLFASLFILTFVLGAEAQTTVYEYAGQNFDEFQGATYDTSMRVTGTVVTSAPIPGNSSGFDARGIVVSWSFSDGVKTITNNSGLLHATRFDFWTDGTGKVTQTDIVVIQGPISTSTGQTDDLIWVVQAFDEGTENVECGTVTQGVCTDWNFGSGAWEAGWVHNPGNWSSRLLTTNQGACSNDIGTGTGVPDQIICVEASARHGDDDAGTQSLTAESGIQSIELKREQASSQAGDQSFPGFDLTRGRAEGLITNVGVPTVGSLSITGGDTGIFTDCDPFTIPCISDKEASATSQVISHLQPLFADPNAPPNSIDLDLILTIDGILDLGWFYEALNIAELSSAIAEIAVKANLHTNAGTTMLFDGGVRLKRDKPDSSILEFFGDWNNAEFIDQGFTIVDNSFFKDVDNQLLEATFGTVTATIRNDPIRTATEFVQAQDTFEDVAFLSPGETFALELEISTYVKSEKLNFLALLSEDFIDCFEQGTCDIGDLQSENFDVFFIDHSFALADMLNTAVLTPSTDTAGIRFAPVNNPTAVPVPTIGPLMLGLLLMLLVLVAARVTRVTAN